jgi:hypothetical protein
MKLRKNLILASVVALMVAVTSAQAAPAPADSSPTSSAELTARTNAMVAKYNAGVDARMKAVKDVKETPDQIMESVKKAKSATEIKALAAKLGTAIRAREMSATGGSDEILLTDPIVSKPVPKKDSSTKGDVGVTSGSLCIFLFTGRNWGTRTTLGMKVACDDSLDGIQLSAQVQTWPLEGWTSTTRLDEEGEGNYTESGWVFQEVKTFQYDGTSPFANTADITGNLIWPPADDGNPSTTVQKMINKKGTPYPVVYDSHSDRTVDFPYAPYNPPIAANYPVFNRLCREEYDHHGWDWMTFSAENHHVKPVRWGGDNVGYNCFRLRTWDHSKFTSWWGSRNYNFETPVSH